MMGKVKIVKKLKMLQQIRKVNTILNLCRKICDLYTRKFVVVLNKIARISFGIIRGRSS